MQTLAKQQSEGCLRLLFLGLPTIPIANTISFHSHSPSFHFQASCESFSTKMPPWHSRAENLQIKKVPIFFCDRHTPKGVDYYALATCYGPTRLNANPSIFVQGPLKHTVQFWQWMSSIAGSNGVQDLPIIPLKAAVLLDNYSDGKPPNVISSKVANKYSLLIISHPNGTVSALVGRRIQEGPFPGLGVANAVMAETVLQGTPKRNIADAVSALNIDIEAKIRLKLRGTKITSENVHQLVAPVSYKAEQVILQRKDMIDKYSKRWHKNDDLYELYKKGYRSGRWKGWLLLLGSNTANLDGNQVWGPWVLMNFTVPEPAMDVAVGTRDPRHCGTCGWCNHGLA